MKINTFKYLIYILLLSLVPNSLLADKLSMKNGDIISGTLGKVSADKIFIKPAYADEFSVNTADVLAIESDTEFEIEMADGEKLVAKFSGSLEGEQLVLTGGDSRTIPITQLAVVAEAEAYYQRVSHADLSMTINNGNTDSQNIMLFADSRVKIGEHRHLAEITFRREEINGFNTKEQDLLNYQYNWLFNDPWYTGVAAAYERDPIKNLDRRYSISAIFGRDIFNTDGRLLSINLGAGLASEKIAGRSDSGAVGTWNLIYNQDIMGGGIKFFHNQSFAYQFFGDNNTIMKTNTGFQFDLVKDIYAKVSFRYDYETDPAPGASKDDSTLAIGIGAQF